MLEKRLSAVLPQAFTADGSIDGIITVADARLFKVKQQVILTANTLPNKDDLEVKRVISMTQLAVGPKSGNIDARADVSAYTVALSGAIQANEQKRPSIPFEELTRATYEEEPTVAQRSLLVDKLGNSYETDNPFPVRLSDGSVNIGSVNAELEVQLSHKDNVPDAGDVADSVRIGDGVEQIEVNPDGSINTNTYEKIFSLLVNANFLKLANYDRVVPSFASNVATLSYYEDDAKIAQVAIRFLSSVDWDMNLEAYINDDDGSILEDDDGSSLLLE